MTHFNLTPCNNLSHTCPYHGVTKALESAIKLQSTEPCWDVNKNVHVPRCKQDVMIPLVQPFIIIPPIHLCPTCNSLISKQYPDFFFFFLNAALIFKHILSIRITILEALDALFKGTGPRWCFDQAGAKKPEWYSGSDSTRCGRHTDVWTDWRTVSCFIWCLASYCHMYGPYQSIQIWSQCHRQFVPCQFIQTWFILPSNFLMKIGIHKKMSC